MHPVLGSGSKCVLVRRTTPSKRPPSRSSVLAWPRQEPWSLSHRLCAHVTHSFYLALRNPCSKATDSFLYISHTVKLTLLEATDSFQAFSPTLGMTGKGAPWARTALVICAHVHLGLALSHQSSGGDAFAWIVSL